MMRLKFLAVFWCALMMTACGTEQYIQSSCVPPSLAGKTVMVNVVSKAKEGRYDFFELAPIEFAAGEFLKIHDAVMVDAKSGRPGYILEIGLAISAEGDLFTGYAKLIQNDQSGAVLAMGAASGEHSDKRGYSLKDIKPVVVLALQSMMCEKAR